MMSSAPADWLSDLWGGDEAAAEAAVAHIAVSPPHIAAEIQRQLSNGLASPDAERRWWAARALAVLPEINVTHLLVKALADTAPDVRQCAALGLRARPDPAAVPPLVQALDDPDGLFRSLCGDALAAIGADAVPALIETLQAGSPPAKLAAARALAAIGDHRSIPALFAALDDESQLVEYWANEGLERMGVGMSFFKPS